MSDFASSSDQPDRDTDGDNDSATLSLIDRQLIVATQAGLPLVPRPYHALAEQLGVSPDEVMVRLQRMQDKQIIRRIAAVPHHYRIGYRANGMTVWDVDDSQARRLGRAIGELEFVSHCYLRPRHLPEWRYNLFAMVHGRSREELTDRIETIARLVHPYCLAHEVLYSSGVLKKTGLRLAAGTA